MRTIKTVIAAAFLLAAVNLQAQLVDAVVGVTGKIMDSETKEPVRIDIIVYDSGNSIINRTNSNAATGYYYIAALKPGQVYTLELSAGGYFKEQYTLNIPNSDKYLEISRDFLVRPLKKDVSLKIKVPPFELNKHKLRFGAALLLEDITKTLKNNPNVNFTIVCYPDNNENVAKNQELTESRANSLKDFFTVNGINPERILVKGKKTPDPDSPIPEEKAAKGKRYIGTTYLKITQIK